MLAYWSLLTYFILGSVMAPQATLDRRRPSGLMLLGFLLIFLLVGLRFRVGADWDNYVQLFSFAKFASIERALSLGDPGYQAVNWMVAEAGASLLTVNLLCAAIFAWGLWRFCRIQPEPWLAAVVAIPYLVIVVAMGYTRQGVAIGILLAGLASVSRGGSVIRFAAYAGVAALFHKTAIVALPLVIFAGERNRFLNFIAGIALAYLFYSFFLASSVDGFVRNYIEAGYASQGAAIRVVMNLVAAILYLTFRRRLAFEPHEDRIWRMFAFAGLAMLPLLLLLPSSTAVDRLALYIIPLQLVVLARVPFLFRQTEVGRLVVATYSALVLFVWLQFAAHSEYWIPYQIDWSR